MRRSSVRAAVVVLLWGVGGVSAEPTTRPVTARSSATIEQLSVRLVELGTGNSDQREAARVSLLALRREDLPILKDAVSALKPLAPAAAGALHDIVVHVYLTGEPYEPMPVGSFLGVQMAGEDLYFDADPQDAPVVQNAVNPGDPIKLRAGVVIAECMPGFCAYGVLVSGDVVLALPDLNRPFLEGKGDLGQTIAQAEPGRRVMLRVLRRGKEIDVPVTLNARPKAAEFPAPGPFNAWMDDRKQLAETYWQETFAGLVGDDVM